MRSYTQTHNQDGTATHDSSADGFDHDIVLELASGFLDHFPAREGDDPRHLALVMVNDERGYISPRAFRSLNISIDALASAFAELIA